jgi:hypothetical protein
VDSKVGVAISDITSKPIVLQNTVLTFQWRFGPRPADWNGVPRRQKEHKVRKFFSFKKSKTVKFQL